MNSVSDLRADGNGNGTVDQADYGVWSGNYGATASPSFSSAVAIPEPAALASLLIGIALAVAGVRNGKA